MARVGRSRLYVGRAPRFKLRSANWVVALLWIVTLAIARGASADDDAYTVDLQLGNEMFALELAADFGSRADGLSGRMSIDENGGMLFSYAVANVLSYWMIDCFVDMDGIFLDSTGRVIAVHEMRKERPQQPGETDERYKNRLPRYTSREPAMFVIELKSGMARRLGITLGQTIDSLDTEAIRALAFGAEARERQRNLAASKQPRGINGWPDIDIAARQASEAVADDDDRRAIVMAALDPSTPTDLDAVRPIVRDLALGGMEDYVASGVAAEVLVRLRQRTSPGLLDPIDLLDELRTLGALRVAALELAIVDRDLTQIVVTLRHILGLAAAISRQPDLQDRIVAAEIEWAALAVLRRAVETRRLGPPALTGCMDLLEGHDVADFEIALRGEAIMVDSILDLAWDRSGAPVVVRPPMLAELAREGRDRATLIRRFLAGSNVASLARLEEVPTLPVVGTPTPAEMPKALNEMDKIVRTWRVQTDRPRGRRGSDRTRAADEMARLGASMAPVSALLPMIAAVVDVEDRVALERSALTTVLALHVLRNENGNWPTDIRDARRAGLKRLPIDPLTGKPFLYRLDDNGEDWTLYSPGTDGRDNKGATHPSDPWRGFEIGDGGKGLDVVVWTHDEPGIATSAP